MDFRRTNLLLLVTPFLLAACAPGEEEGEGEAAEVAEVAPAPPDTTADALWAHLEEADYQHTWSLWPGKGELYQGQEPHGMLLTTYVNSPALDAISNQAGTLPAGAIIVKENYMPDSTFAAATIMYKSAGYDPDHDDWFWMKRLADGTVEAQGRVGMCFGCHASNADNDYLMTAPIK